MRPSQDVELKTWKSIRSNKHKANFSWAKKSEASICRSLIRDSRQGIRERLTVTLTIQNGTRSSEDIIRRSVEQYMSRRINERVARVKGNRRLAEETY